jgi:hypothetical protein
MLIYHLPDSLKAMSLSMDVLAISVCEIGLRQFDEKLNSIFVGISTIAFPEMQKCIMFQHFQSALKLTLTPPTNPPPFRNNHCNDECLPENTKRKFGGVN